MRAILWLWFTPLVLFWGWYGLASNGIDFGLHIFSKEVHDILFGLYGKALGVPASSVPGLAFGACVLDSILVLGIAAFRWRKKWFPQAKALFAHYWNDDEVSAKQSALETSANDYAVGSVGPMHPAE
ncbi:MAG: DUF6105 family protein [Nitratireductor sp.]